MSKVFKIFLIVIFSFFAIVVIYNIFSGNTANIKAENGEPPFIISLLVSWTPMLIITTCYIVFLRMFKKLIDIGERIATALESKGTGDSE